MPAIDWMTCPVCGARASIVPGRYISLLTGDVWDGRSEPRPDLGKGSWGMFTIESDAFKWPEPCPGYYISLEEVRHLDAEGN